MLANKVQNALLFVLFHTATTLIALVLGFVWYMSPLGLGFQQWPNDPIMLTIASTAFWLSYFIGLPLLLIGQTGSAILAITGRTRAAFSLPLISLGFFLLNVAIVLTLIGPGA